MRSLGKLIILVAFLLSPSTACFAEVDGESKLTPTESERLFLDRLMRAESGGRRYAKNPLSSALGPFQFLDSTFRDIVQRNMPGLIAGKTDAEILDLRTDPKISRDVALIYTRENASVLAAKGVEVTPANLRLAFFAGAGGALKVLEAKPDEPVSNILSAAAIQANPFLKDMTASQLLQRAARESQSKARLSLALAKPPTGTPQIAVQCNLKLASCRKWLALAEKRLAKATRLASTTAQR